MMINESRRSRAHFDLPLVLLVFGLAAFGVLAVSVATFSTSSAEEDTLLNYIVASYYGLRQSIFFLISPVIIGVITERLQEPDCKDGYILDGVPRTIAQAEALEAAGIHFDHVVSLEVSDEEVEQRMTGRRTCLACGATYHIVANPPKKEGICDICGKELTIRKDDKPETVKDRLATYHAETEPLKGFYEARGILSSVENKGSIDATNAAVMEVLTK